MTKEYRIAEYPIRIKGNNWEELFGHFGKALKIFEVETKSENPILILDTDYTEELDMTGFQTLDEFFFPEVEASCTFQVRGDEYLLNMSLKDSGSMWFKKSYFTPEVKSNISECVTLNEFSSLVRFGMWIMFGIAINPLGGIAIHSSAIMVGRSAVLCLGESGTGKSTHTRLWRENIEGAELLNDDSPIIRMWQGEARVFGSPWSGKSPCYKQISCLIKGLIRLSQAPHNKIKRLGTIASIGALLPSCPPAFAYDERLQDAICSTLSDIISHTKVFHLECLPNPEAALLSLNSTIKCD